MRAVVWDGRKLRLVSDAPPPIRREGTALVRVRTAGICSTDLQILDGYLGFRGVLGHEFVGEVIDGVDDWNGRRVVGEINFSCGRCPTCQASRRRHCPARSVLGILGADGAFADVLRIPEANLHLVPDEIDDRTAVFVEPLAAAFEAAEQTRGYAGGRSIVLGAGKLGLLVAQVLARRGDRVEVVCRNDRARGVVESLTLTPVDPRSATRGADLVVDATGSEDGLAFALELVRPLGALVLKSTVAARYALDLAPLVINEITVIGSRCGPFRPAIEALARREIAVAPLVDAVVPLDGALEAFERASLPGALKVLIEAV